MTDKEANKLKGKTIKRVELVFDDGQKAKLDTQTLICFASETDIHVRDVGLSMANILDMANAITNFIINRIGM